MMMLDRVEIAKLELQDGDILLVKIPPDWTGEMQHSAHRAFEMAIESTGAKAKVLMGPKGLEVEIIRKEAA